MIERRRIRVEGVVQGVGFRPYVLRLATALELGGSVRNDCAGVLIEVQGERAALDGFARRLAGAAPPLARVARVTVEHVPSRAGRAATTFAIAGSDGRASGDGGGAALPPDVATCEACAAELLDPADRRFRYPFISCTDCGPRLTITRAMPFDRDRTTMAAFTMCVACRREYEAPADRRFHAQTNACAACGPAVSYIAGPAGAPLSGDAALGAAVAALTTGRIVAIKGLGGYHLACDATDGDAVQRLRRRKHREAKPFALMMAGIDVVRSHCTVSAREAGLLRSAERPIVLLERLARDGLEGVAPGMRELGVMLPYTPLHVLLLAGAGRPLVLTSANRAGEPIVCDDAVALRELRAVADAFLTHDREIAVRADDSVVRVARNDVALVRRSRGYAPRSLPLAPPPALPVLAVGGHLKNAFCLADGRGAFLSPHVGDLDHPDALAALRSGIAHYTRLLGVVPRVVAHDLHPDYLSTRVAHEIAADAHVAVQHHHAHVAACVAEHGVTGPVLGVAFDGTGLGADGAIWGGEFLLVDGADCERVGHLGYVPLPGGDAAARAPWRAAATHLWAAYGDGLDALDLPSTSWRSGSAWPVIRQMLRAAAHAPPTSSVGRLFDAVASLAGLRNTADFEGQAAMELEAVADRTTRRAYPLTVSDGAVTIAEPSSIVRGVVDDVAARRPTSEIAGAFHTTMAELVAEVAARCAERTGVRRVALSGGVFQNRLLLERAATRLEGRGLTVLTHRRVPCNDGGLALGQAYVAARLAARALQDVTEEGVCA